MSQKGDLNIVLFDANSYYVSCHQAVEPQYANKPIIVGGDPKKRTGIVLASSYEARAFGVKTTMPIGQALKLCPHAVILRPDFSLYLEFSEKMWAIVERYTDKNSIEIVSIDECYADFTGSHRIFGDTVAIAKRIQNEIWNELRIGVSVGVSFCKVFAKLASELDRDERGLKRPRGFTIISRENFKEKVWPLPASYLSGIGQKTAEELKRLNIFTIGDLAHAENHCLKPLGVFGEKLKLYAQGKDDRPVSPDQPVKNHSIGRSVTLPHDIQEEDDVAQVLLSLADHVGRELRKQKYQGRTVTLQIKTADFKTYNFSHTMSVPVNLTETIYDTALYLYKSKWNQRAKIRLLGISLSNLCQEVHQLSLFDEKANRKVELEHTVDRLRDRFGIKIIRGSQLLDLGREVFDRQKNR